MFYSRRIGRAPQLGDFYGDAGSPTASRILGAGKLTGRLPGGMSVGVLEAMTQRVAGRADTTIEPRTNYSVVRLQQDLRGGGSGVGIIFTGVNRDLDPVTAPLLRREAYVGAVDARHRFAHATYELGASLDVSRVEGSPQAIASTQRSSVHYYQRPDAGLPYDTTRTRLSGDAEEVRFGKIAGRHTNFETSYQRRSSGFEINDLGFLQRADQQSWNNWFALRFNHPNRVFQRTFWNFNWWQYWTSRGMAQERAANTNVHMQLTNRWWVHVGGTLGQLGTTYCDRCARGGPAVRQEPYFAPWFGFEGDDRHILVPNMFFNFVRSDGGRSEYFNTNGTLRVRASTRVQPSLGFSYSRNRNDVQPFGNYGTSPTHYTFAHLEQRQLSLTARLDYTIRTMLTLQVYAQPFVSKGTFSNVRELAVPRAANYDARYQPYVGVTPGGFNFKQFNSNVVLRWEYRPGSTLFLVWTQGRQPDVLPAEGTQGFKQDISDLFDAHPLNTFLIKASYWLNW